MAVEDDSSVTITGDPSGAIKAAAETNAALEEVAQTAEAANHRIEQSGETSANAHSNAWHRELRKIRKMFHEVFLPLGIGTLIVREVEKVADQTRQALIKKTHDEVEQVKNSNKLVKELNEAALKEYKNVKEGEAAINKIFGEASIALAEEVNKRTLDEAKKGTLDLISEQTSRLLLAANQIGAANVPVLSGFFKGVAQELEEGLDETAESASKRLQKARKQLEEARDKALTRIKIAPESDEEARKAQEQNQQRLKDQKAYEEETAKIRRESLRRQLDEEQKLKEEYDFNYRKTYLENESLTIEQIKERRRALTDDYLDQLEEIRKKREEDNDKVSKQIDEEVRKWREATQKISDMFDKLRQQQEAAASLFLGGISGDSQVAALEQFMRSRER